MNAELFDLVTARLAEAGLGEGIENLVLSACQGRDALVAELDGTGGGGEGEEPARAAAAERVAYLTGIEVEGFRGVARAARLDIAPGPGLTLVVGRNGSGKSSFAEGLELLLTGSTSRWADKGEVWSGGWRNLHHDGGTRISADFALAGVPGTTTVARAWTSADELDDGREVVTGEGRPPESLQELGWSAAIRSHRPFLSYGELGAMFEDNRAVYERLWSVLGLADLERMRDALQEESQTREREMHAFETTRGEWIERLATVDDERARIVHRALGAGRPDLDAAEAVVLGHAGEREGSEVDILRQLVGIRVPRAEAVERAVAGLSEAISQSKALAGSNAEREAHEASLLENAIEYFDAHADGGHCPVCEGDGALDPEWREAAGRRAAELRTSSESVGRAEAALAEAALAVHGLLREAPPAALADAAQVGVAAEGLEAAWRRWSAGSHDAASNRDRLLDLYADVASETRAVDEAARAELDRRHSEWIPLARELGEWLPLASRTLERTRRLDELAAAWEWARATADEITERRVAPISRAAQRNWELLREKSNVTLERLALVKRGRLRRAEIDVRVDGSDADGLSVMSQGELNALAVSLFLPRASLEQSPFRFMALDDPVQSMDPAKVDGLAFTLAKTAQERQVVVFTHDDRLPDALRRLKLPARVVEVTRRARSQVTVRPALDPVKRNIDDARAIALTDNVPAEVAGRVVPGFCRYAIEAACADAFRRRRLLRGERHGEVEAELAGARTLFQRVALALFDDARQAKRVAPRVTHRFGQRAMDVLADCNRGAHGSFRGDLVELIRGAEELARAIEAER